MLITISIIAVLSLLIIVFNRKKSHPEKLVLNPEYRMILEESIDFYKKLDPKEQQEFEHRIAFFLKTKRIEGVKCEIEKRDEAFVACGAMIPIFRFPEYYYPDLNVILIYPEQFDRDYQFTGSERRILGMVGEGNEMRATMILSLKALRQGFKNQVDGRNVAIHEFIHLVDGDDRDIDGLPKALLSNQQTIPFLKLIHSEMKKIEENKSKLNPYGGTNEAEFFAVASEFFFENPKKMKKHHPELFRMLNKIFNPN